MRLNKLLASAITLQLWAFNAHAVDMKIKTAPTTMNVPGATTSPTGVSQTGPYVPPTGSGAVQSSEVGSKQLIDPNALSADAENRKAQAEEKAKSCIDRTKNAGLACATMSVLTGMDPGTGAMIETMITSQLPALIGQMSSGGSAAHQCKVQEDINNIVKMITTAKTVACVAMSTSCSSTCKQDYAQVDGELATTRSEIVKAKAALANPATNAAAQSALETLEPQAQMLSNARQQIADEQRRCSSYKGNLPIMLMQAGISFMNSMKASQCADALSNVGATATPISLVDSNVDCSNAAFAATNPVCICRSNPGDPMCGSLNNGGYTPGGGSVGGGSVTTPGMNGALGEDGVEIGETPTFQGTGGSNQAGNGGGGGGLPGGGGAGGGLGGGEGEGGGGSGLDKNVIQGTSGGGGGGISPLTAGGGGGSGMKAGGGGAGGGSGFDFKKYLPKSLFKNRGLAGMTVPSTDGVTGPMGPSLWEKVTNRYQVKKSTLIQDK